MNESRRVATVLEEEMGAAFERIHASGKAPERRLSAEWSTVVDRVAARSRQFLSEEQARRVVAALGAPFAR